MKTANSALTSLIILVSGIVSCTNGNNHNTRDQIVIDSLTAQVKLLSGTIQRNMENKQLVADFYQELFGDKNIDAIDKYIGDTYIQHNPSLPDGKEFLKEGAKAWFKGAPKEKIDIQHLSGDGDLVYIHTKVKSGNRTSSVLDIFRLQDGKILEHWDIIQQVPEKSANPHPMF